MRLSLSSTLNLCQGGGHCYEVVSRPVDAGADRGTGVQITPMNIKLEPREGSLEVPRHQCNWHCNSKVVAQASESQKSIGEIAQAKVCFTGPSGEE